MDLLAFERKLDATIQRKRLEIQEVIRRPMKQRRKLRVFISHRFFTPEPEGEVRATPNRRSGSGCHILPSFLQETAGVPQWELKVEGRLLDQVGLLWCPLYSCYHLFAWH